MFDIVEYEKDSYPKDEKKDLKNILLLYHDFEKFLLTYEDNKLKFLKDLRYIVEKY